MNPITTIATAAAIGAGIAPFAAVTAGWFSLMQPWHARLAETLEQRRTITASKLRSLLVCPYCQSWWFALAVTLAAGQPWWLAAPAWGIASVVLAAIEEV